MANFKEQEEQILKFWQENKIFEKSLEKESPKGDYVFYDGPPFATGEPHYGHIVASLIKDVVPRYQTMRGFHVERKWGWDCHGLPIENIAEKELGITQKKDIEKIGVEKFNEFCRSKVLGYVDVWKKVINRLGRWADMENSYKTMDLDFMESVWWVFKNLWDKGLIYEGYRSMHICPRCETTLSQSEVSEGYKIIKDLSCIAKFKLLAGQKIGDFIVNDNTYILAWTTTPWTLIGNVALAVGADIDYSVWQVKNLADNSIENYLFATNLVNKIFNNNNFQDENGSLQELVVGGKDNNFEYTLLKRLNGQDLTGLEYEAIFDDYANQKMPNHNNGWKVYAADFVTTEEGTGIVHIAPAFGEDDMNLGKQYQLPFVQHVNMDGSIKDEVGSFAGLNVKPVDDTQKTDVEIIKYLAGKKLLFTKEKYEHSYPHCWRCDTPLINYATSSWFVKVAEIKDRSLQLAEQINWSPDHIKEGRFGNWLAGARDWSISRQRYWASVMPIWRCEKCGELEVFGSVADLENKSGQKITDIHKHVVDKITFSCDKCDGKMNRIPDVLDTWFDSGSMPYAQMHYPFANKEKFEANFPAQFIGEGVDQTRCWFYYLHILATAIMDKPAYKNVIVNGIVLAEDGKKMSKRLKNYPDPMVVMEKFGADALRLYLLSSPVMEADNLNMSEKGVQEMYSKLNMLANVVEFYQGYSAELNEKYLVIKSDNILDLWILTQLQVMIKNMTQALEGYDLVSATRPIVSFVAELSQWYLRRSRDRFKGDNEDDKQHALATLTLVLFELSKVIAPFAPFMAESVYKVINKNAKSLAQLESVHLEDWPQLEEKEIDESVLENMVTARKIVELAHSLRAEKGIKVRQPLNGLLINTQLEVGLQEIIASEVNVKNIIIKETIEKNEKVAITDYGKIVIGLDLEITEKLRQEGILREIIRQINSYRKDQGLTINDSISLKLFTSDDQLKEVIKNYLEQLKNSVLASEINLIDNDEGTELKIDSSVVKISHSK